MFSICGLHCIVHRFCGTGMRVKGELSGSEKYREYFLIIGHLWSTEMAQKNSRSHHLGVNLLSSKVNEDCVARMRVKRAALKGGLTL